ncbi:MAG: ornithine cyclodeaminase family protein [Bradyrhizobium sp.]|nr:MAG: ornithine cyclodeaminase family protein [Bradyrhizobium sp.]
MRHFTAPEIDAALDFPSLIDALAEAFRGGFQAPARSHHEIERPGEAAATMLLMPAWGRLGGAGDILGVKIVNVFPGNGARGLSAVQGLYALQSGVTGATLATLDGTRLTLWRTAAASALAARFLAPPRARRLLMVGAGALAPFLARAHASQRPIEHIAVWNHRPEGARRLAAALAAEGYDARAVENLPEAVAEADIIACATLSPAPLIAGAWLKPGQHIDLVGAFSMHMREADDAALKRARIFVDAEGALSEGGDVAIALRSGAIVQADVAGDLASLVCGAPGRTAADEITLFKSVGAAIEDLAAAALVWRRTGGN